MPLKQFPLSSSFLIVLFVCLFVCLLFENVEVEIKKNKISRSVDETAQAVLNRLLVSSAIYWIRNDWHYCTYEEPRLIIRV